MLKPAHIYAEHRDWPGYFQAVANKGPRETLTGALNEFAQRSPHPKPSEFPLAIDLGCGEGRDTAELLRQGFTVLAIDSHPQAAQLLDARTDISSAMRSRLKFIQAGFENLQLPPAALISASFALPFCPPNHFAALWQQITTSLPRSGLFCGQLFGNNDTWATLPDRSHHTRAEVNALLAPFNVLDLKEENKPGQEFDGKVKHWHVYHIIATKR